MLRPAQFGTWTAETQDMRDKWKLLVFQCMDKGGKQKYLGAGTAPF